MKVGILITTFNRPEYLELCLDSLNVADIPSDAEVLIVDDGSTNEETIRLIRESGYTVILNNKNQSIKHSLLVGCDFLFEIKGCKEITNLDGDAMVKPNFLTVLRDLKYRFFDHLITGFNCLTKNRDGSERHKVLMTGEGFNMKKSVGGVNMYFDQAQYNRWIRPAIVKCMETQGNWDHQSCIAASKDVPGVICAVPSVVQHIGVNSSMGHSLSEPPDVADDFFFSEAEAAKIRMRRVQLRRKPSGSYVKGFKLPLKDVTLVGADCFDVTRLVKAVDVSCSGIDFGAVKIFSDQGNDERIIKIGRIANKAEYSVFIMKFLAQYIDTSHLLIVQHDGFVLNADAWNDKWLQYDYIGAPWMWYTEKNVGNGGFSLRSKRLHTILATDPNIIPQNEPRVTTNKEEDHCICRIYRNYLEAKYKIKFAPIEVAEKFSIEAWSVTPPGNKYNGQFGFHGRSVDFSDTPAHHHPSHLIQNL